jgi:YD repeat-containing protein
MYARTSPKVLYVVPGLAWVSMAVAAWWLITQKQQLGRRVPWRYDLLGRPTAWHDTTAGALVAPIAIGACAVTCIAVGNWLLLRARHTSAPLVQRTLSVAEVMFATLAVEVALLPVMGTRLLVLTMCLGLPIAITAIAHADLAGDKRRRDEVGEELKRDHRPTGAVSQRARRPVA